MESLDRDEDLPHRKVGSGLNSNSVGRPPKLREEHKDFVVRVVDEKPDIVLEEMMKQLNVEFMGLEIKKTTLHDFLVKKCQFTLTRAHFHSVERNSPEKIEERYTWVTRWQKTDMDFLSNCVFIDEAAFHINIKRNYAWSQKGTRAVVIVPKTRARTITILGAISSFGVVNIQVKLPKVIAASKKRKALSGSVQYQKD